MRDHACPAFPSFVELTESPHGRMLFPVTDQYVGRSFQEYGEFSSGELEVFRHFVRPGAVVLDVGANIGAHTVPLAQMAGPDGLVMAFEPQRILFHILCANLALNSVTNTLTYATALGSRAETCKIPISDYGKPNNYGGLSIDQAVEGETVVVEPLDSFQLNQVDFIKIDVEGFERRVLEGGMHTIQACRPVLYVENDRKANSEALIQLLLDWNFRLWWHTPPLFNPDNWKGNSANVFPGIVSVNMLAIPREQAPAKGLTEILSSQDWWQ